MSSGTAVPDAVWCIVPTRPPYCAAIAAGIPKMRIEEASARTQARIDAIVMMLALPNSDGS